MGRTTSILAIGTGALLLPLGLLFLLGAGGHLRRMVIAGIFLLLSGLLIGFGLRARKRLELIQPERLREDLLELARQRNGEISQSDIDAGLGWRAPHVRPVIGEMEREGRCRRALEKGREFFIFPELQPRLMVLYCEYCEAEYPISEDLKSCPNCGGPIVKRVSIRSLSEGEVFSMDEEDGEMD